MANRGALYLTGFFLSLCFSACTTIQDFGNDVLSTFGLQPSQSEFSAGESIARASQQLSREEEYYLGRAVAARILSLYPQYSDQALYSYVNKVGTALLVASSEPYTFGGYHFIVLDSPEINAFSAPGGFVFITKGLLEAMPDEDALAAVLAHEIVHVTNHHGVRSISKDNMSDALKTIGMVAGTLNCNELLLQAVVVFSAAADEVANTLIESGYNRNFEFEADAGAHEILARAGYTQAGLEDALHTLDKRGERSSGGWFRTHPQPSERLEALHDVGISPASIDGIVGTAHARMVRLRRFDTAVRKSSS